MEGQKSTREVAKYDEEYFEEQKNRQLADERQNRHARKVFHRHSRSSSRASASSDKARNEVKEIGENIVENKKTLKTYDDAVDAIDSASDAKRNKAGIARGSSGIDAVRSTMMRDSENPCANFDASRGAHAAAETMNKNLNIKFDAL